MDFRFRESRPILPRQLTYLLAGVMFATVAFMAVCKYAMDIAMPDWAVPILLAVSAAMTALAWLARLTVTVDDSGLQVKYAIRTVQVPWDEIIDCRAGELALIRSYDKWNLKGVKHKAYMAIGEDLGVAVKLTAKRVLVLSSAEPEALNDLLRKEVSE